jgi:hypothetical protein
MTRSEAIREARQMRTAGHFRRQIPDDMHYNQVELECGHSQLMHVVHLETLAQLKEAPSCRACLAEWIEAHIEVDIPDHSEAKGGHRAP